MSVERFLEQLLDGAEVEWKALGEIAEYSKSRISSDQLNKSNYVGVDNLLQHRGGKIDSNYVPSSGNLTEYREGDILIGNIRPYLRKIWLADRTGGTNADVLVVHTTDDILNSCYLFQVLTDEKFFNYNIKHSKGAKMPRGSKPKILQYPVPIPCPDDPEKSLAIQREIVRRLDAFTELTTELSAELSARKKQYNHYRDQLLTFDDGEVEWKTLGDLIATIKTGKLNANAMVEGGKYPFFTCDANPFRIDTYSFDTEAIIVSGNGSQVGHINYYKGKFNAYQRTYILADCSDEITIGFLLTYLKAYLRSYIVQHSKKGSVPYITMPMLQNYRIPVPGINHQVKIVAILDKFDALTTSLTDGLPREIELRQKQYEYYRDQLLNFPKSEEAAA